MKPRTKKRLIVIGTLLFLGDTIYREFNNNYFRAKRLGQTYKSQVIFWKDVDEGSMIRAGVDSFYTETGGLSSLSNNKPKYFSLKLNDQWTAYYYGNDYWNNGYVFEIMLYHSEERTAKGFSFYVNQNNLTVIKDDKKYRDGPTSPEELKKRDAETTPDSITDTDYLEKLALDKFVEFQDEYFKVNGY